MKSEQYEELCRFFLSEKFGIPAAEITSPLVPNPRRPNLPAYQHQIDLLWETASELALYLHIANAKWRSRDKVDQPEVLLLQQVKQKIAAHKAVMITNTGFTAGAIAVARDDGIALHIVSPAPELERSLVGGDREQLRQQLQSLAASRSTPLYSHTIETRGVEVPHAGPPQGSSVNPASFGPPPGNQTRVGATPGRAISSQQGTVQVGPRPGYTTRDIGPRGKK